MFTKVRSSFLLSCCILLLFGCGNEKDTESISPKQEESTKAVEETNRQESSPAKAEDGPSIAIITAPRYIVKVHKAIAFVPKDDGAGMMKAKEGHRFVVLDMSAKNTGNEPIETGQILLSVDIKDDNGNRYPVNAMEIAAYTFNYPNSGHQSQYD